MPVTMVHVGWATLSEWSERHHAPHEERDVGLIKRVMEAEEHSAEARYSSKAHTHVMLCRMLKKSVSIDKSMRAEGTCANGAGHSVNMAIINHHATDHLVKRHTGECEHASSCV